MRPLRVLVVSDVSPVTVEGGAERVLREQVTRLTRAGHEVRVLSRAPAGTAAGVSGFDGARVRHFIVDRRSLLRFIHSSIFEARRSAALELAEWGADVLHVHQPLSGHGVLTSPRGRGIPSLYTFLSPAPLEYSSRRGMTAHHRGGVAGGLGTALLWLTERACLRRATRIHVLSDFSADQLWRLYRIPLDRIVKVPGGVDLARFRPPEDRAAVRKGLGLPAGVPLLFTVRNLEARMGLDALIRAVARLRHELPDLLLLVGGSGSLRAELEALVARLHLADHVRFLGFVPEAELPRYYQAADAFVLPTRELEGFGLVTVEALACGTPVLGTPVGATPELLRPLDHGLVFRDPGPEAIADGVLRFLEWGQQDPAAAARLRQACRREAIAHYAWDGAVARLEATLVEVARRAAPPTRPAPACPACGGPMRAGDLYYAGNAYARCPGCGTGVAATLPAADRLRRYYETEYPLRYGHQWVAVPRADMFGSLLDRLGGLSPPGRLVDVGCGGGHLLRAAAERGWRAVGTDVAHVACAAARRQHGLAVFQAESARLPVRDGCADATTLVNVLDHVLDPAAVLREAYRALAPGGHLVVRVPNARFHRPAVRVVAALGPLARWRAWDRYPILHLYAFTPAGLRRLAAQAGFRVLAIRNSPLAAQPGAGGRRGARAIALGALRATVAVWAAAVALASGGRVICGPSLELYATRLPGRTADGVGAP